MSTEALDVLLLRLAGPLQAWGAETKEDTRPTLPFPSRSGLVGLLAACLGIRRDERDRLVALSEGLRFAVRQDAKTFEPAFLSDFQTIADAPTADGKSRSVVKRAEYLVDSSFTAAVAVASPQEADRLVAACESPTFVVYLGRKCCLPSEPLYLGRAMTDSPLDLLAATSPGGQKLWSEFPVVGAERLRVRDVPTDDPGRFATRTVYYSDREGNA